MQKLQVGSDAVTVAALWPMAEAGRRVPETSAASPWSPLEWMVKTEWI